MSKDIDEHEHHHEHHHEHDHHHEHEHEHHHDHDHHHHHEHEHHHHHNGCCCGHEHGHSHEHGEEEHELTVKQLIFAAVLFVLGLVIEHLPVADWFSQISKIDLIHRAVFMVLYFAAYIITGKDIVIGAVSNLIHGELMDEAFLMTVASLGAILLGEYEEAVAIMILYQVGEKFEDYAVDKSRDSIEEIAKLRPDHATVKIGAETREVEPDEVETDSVIIVKPGDRIPIDGVVVDGESFIDTSALTGESIPRRVSIGDEVLSGSINKQGVLEIRTTRHSTSREFWKSALPATQAILPFHVFWTLWKMPPKIKQSQNSLLPVLPVFTHQLLYTRQLRLQSSLAL